MIGRDGHARLDLDHRHRCLLCRNFGEHAHPLGIEVLHDQESHAGPGRERSEQLADGLEPAGRGPDADHRDGRVLGSCETHAGRSVARAALSSGNPVL